MALARKSGDEKDEDGIGIVRGSAVTAADSTWNERGTVLIRERNTQRCRDLLTRLGNGRLGVVRNNQRYVIPIYLVYEPDCLYGFSRLHAANLASLGCVAE